MSDGRRPSDSPASGQKISFDLSSLRYLLASALCLLAGCSSVWSPYLAKQSLSDGNRWMDQRDYDRAEASLVESLRWNPRDPEAWCRLGEIHLTTEDYPKAGTDFEECLKRDPLNGDGQAGLWAVRLMEEGYTEEIRKTVRSEIESYLSEGPPSSRRWMAAYQGFQFLHDTEAALSLAFRIMQFEPSDEMIETLTWGAAEEIMAMKDPQKRLVLIEEYLPLFPRGFWHNQVYASLLKTAAVDLEDTEKLREYAERWIRQEPDNRVAYAASAHWYLEKEIEAETAARYLEKAVRLIDHPDPRDKPAHYPEELWREDLEKVKGRYYDDLGWAYFRSGQLKEAETAFRQAALLLPFDHRLYTHLGRLLEQRGDMSGALAAYLKSAKGGNDLPMAEEGLRRLLPPVPDGPLSPYKVFAAKEGVTCFTDVTQEARLSEIQSGRAAWGDYDNDGFEDLLFNGKSLMRNQGDGTFRNVTMDSGIPDLPGANGGIWADFNNDGFLDFYTFVAGTEYGDRLFKNKGSGTFEDVTAQAFDVPDRYPTEAAAWGDYDRDGFVDLYVANYERPLATTIDRAIGNPHRLYRNRGDETFEEVSASAGAVSREKMIGRGVSWGDYDNDGDSDIFVSDYRLDPNLLWRNNGNGGFTEVGRETDAAGSEVEGLFGHTIGSVWGDYDNDGDLDLFSANLAHPRYIGVSNKSMLLENLGPPDYRFADRFGTSGVRFEETHAEPSFVDYDNDGALDLYITSTYQNQNSFLYRGNGNGFFEDVTYLAGVRVENGWGNAFADMDNDGDLDLVVAGGGGVRLFRNEGNSHSWLQVKVVGTRSNRSGIGSRVKVVTGTISRIREVEGGKGSGSQHALPVSFGFGDYRGAADIEVRFSSGKIVRKTKVPLNRRIVILEE